MTTITALAAISSVGLEMTSLATMPVTRMATKPAWKAGWVLSVTKVCVHAAGWVGECWVACRFWCQVPTLPARLLGWQGGVLLLSGTEP